MTYHPCICERAYRGEETGVSFIDNWLYTHLEDWPTDWYEQVYTGRVDHDELDVELARKLKYRIEANCTATIHYPTLLADDMYGGRAVYTSTDQEKQEENQERSEHDLWLAANPFESRKLVEYRGASANADFNDELFGTQTSDVLTHQREANTPATPSKGGTVQMTFDGLQAESNAERVALRRIRAEEGKAEPTIWEIQMYRNKARIRAKNEQARRDLWLLVNKTDEATRAILIGYIQDEKKKGKKYIEIIAGVRRTVRASATVAA